jgi:hypothetical protein
VREEYCSATDLSLTIYILLIHLSSLLLILHFIIFHPHPLSPLSVLVFVSKSFFPIPLLHSFLPLQYFFFLIFLHSPLHSDPFHIFIFSSFPTSYHSLTSVGTFSLEAIRRSCSRTKTLGRSWVRIAAEIGSSD